MQTKLSHATPSAKALLRMGRRTARVHPNVVRFGKLSPYLAFEIARSVGIVTGQPVFVTTLAHYNAFTGHVTYSQPNRTHTLEAAYTQLRSHLIQPQHNN